LWVQGLFFEKMLFTFSVVVSIYENIADLKSTSSPNTMKALKAMSWDLLQFPNKFVDISQRNRFQINTGFLAFALRFPVPSRIRAGWWCRGDLSQCGVVQREGSDHRQRTTQTTVSEEGRGSSSSLFDHGEGR